MMPEVDPRALKILLKTHWSSAGWREKGACSSDDFQYAKLAGLMFDDVFLSHQDIVSQVAKTIGVVDRCSVANAFVVSLPLRRLDIRSALGSFAVLQHFPQHTPSEHHGICSVCGEYLGPAKMKDLNVLNFERFKWGGVRHDNPLYASFDLQLFQKLPRLIPAASDVTALKDVLNAIEAAPAKTTSAAIAKLLGKSFKSSKQECEVMVQIFGYCGILETAAHPGYMNGFIRSADRELPDRGDMNYPARWWRRSDGINKMAVDYWFGHLL